MQTYLLGQLTVRQLQELVEIRDSGVEPERWASREQGTVAPEEQSFIEQILRHLRPFKVTLLTEANLWARAIFPLLLLAEEGPVHAFAEVPLSATLHRGELRGEVDGALARMGISAEAVPPYLLVVEAKRGIEGHEPLGQLIGGLLCAAWQNQQQAPRSEHRLFGVYTVADVWTFAEVVVRGLEGERPVVMTSFSREYTEKVEAVTILRILKSLVAETRATLE